MVSFTIVKYFIMCNLLWHKEWQSKNSILIFFPQMVSQLSSNYLLINLPFLCWSETSFLSWIIFSYVFRCISRLLCSMVSTCPISHTYMLICEGGKQGSVLGQRRLIGDKTSILKYLIIHLYTSGGSMVNNKVEIS